MSVNGITSRVDSSDRAVSPVIGVILMVAITVILAAVVGTFVLDMGATVGDTAPRASLSVTADASNDVVNVSHQGGDPLNSGDTRVTISNDSESVTYEPAGSDTFIVGEEIGFSVNTDPPSTTWALSDADSSNRFALVSGNQYEVQIVDLQSQRVVFLTTVTA